MNRDTLDPWRVICSRLLELSSYEIPKILDQAGLAVNWSLKDRQNYSHETRKAAYRPRINSAYEGLLPQDQMRMAFVVASELANRGLSEALNADLAKIGWTVRTGALTPTGEDVRELFFPPSTPHDAFVEIRNIIKRVRTSIVVVDPYLDGSIFALLASVADTAKSIHLLTFNFPADFTVEAKKFASQYNIVDLEIRRSKEFHDRFLVLDGCDCWHIGASIKDAGGKAFMLSRIEDERNRNALLQQAADAWQNATPVPT